MEQFKNFKRELTKLEQMRAETKNTTSDRIAIKLQQDNLKMALYDDTIEKVIEIWNKYKNKQLGERTKEQIIDEIQQHFNNKIYVYISNYNSYDESISIALKNENNYCNNNYRIEIITNEYNIKLLKNNQIQEITKEQTREKETKQYIKNPQEQANKIIKLHEKAKQLQEQLNEISHDIHELSNYKIDCVKYCSCVSNWCY